jgi:hypothetical protein
MAQAHVAPGQAKGSQGMTKAEHERAEQILWRMAVLKIVMFSVLSLLTCWMTATNGLDMTKLSAYEWAQTVMGCVCSFLVTMIAFVDKSAAQVSAGKIPGIENGQLEEPKPKE